MCVKICECWSCRQKRTCTDCEYIDSHNLTDEDCGIKGVQNCKHYIQFQPPKEMIEKERWRLDVVGKL